MSTALLVLAAVALTGWILRQIHRDRTPASTGWRGPNDIPPGWTRNERGALVPPVPASPQRKGPRHARTGIPVQTVREKTLARKPTPDRQPWQTAANPRLQLEPEPDSGHYPAEEFTDLPVVPRFMRQAVYGETCEANVLAGAYLP